MDTIILPIAAANGAEKFTSESEEINIAALLSCSRRTINSYVEKGLLPQPLSEKDGVLYFSKEAVVEALGLKDLDEELVDIKEAAKILKIDVATFVRQIKKKKFTEIKLKGNVQSKRFYLKRELLEFDIEIEAINKPLEPAKELKFIKMFFSKANIHILNHILSESEIDVLRGIFVEKKSFEEIGKEYDIPADIVEYIYYRAMPRMEKRLKYAVQIIQELEKRTIMKMAAIDIAKLYQDKFTELTEKIISINSLIEKEEEKITLPLNLNEIKIPENCGYYINVSLQALLNTKLKDLNLTVRCMTCLRAAKLQTIGDLVRLSKADLMKARNFGRKSLNELEELLRAKGLKFNKEFAYKGTPFYLK
jgi:DNA-binding transcriptional MerR regulator